ncbi:hypothetical protein VPNG_05031 [Cytospora leucostoma]|uniref:Uncharacterized protein n=1 Tax=Cytospora leucostoma TaxID=1230097 RepID=A0A423X823_9PEZI|nr:hypothetical protein VPNG_05031 [Cytospora leucostoma]
MESSLVESSDGSVNTQATQNRDLIEQQLEVAQKFLESGDWAVQPSPGNGESQGAHMEIQVTDGQSKARNQEPLEVQGAPRTNEPQDSISSESRPSPDVEMMDNPEESPTPSDSEEGIDMLDKYAFNFDRDAYNHHVPPRFINGTTLYVGRLHPQTTNLAQHYENVEAKDEVDTCPPLIPHELELKSKDRKAVECVWVGMLPGDEKRSNSASVAIQPQAQLAVGEAQVDGSAERKANKKGKKGTRIIDLVPDEMNIISYDPNALRVVAKKSKKMTQKWFLYALINPDPTTNLCQGWRVGSDEVFYFKAFRGDEAKSYQPRKRITQEKIAKVIFPDEPKPSAAASQLKQSSGLLSPRSTAESPKVQSRKSSNESVKTSDTVRTSRSPSRDAANDNDNAMNSPVSSVEADDGPVGDDRLSGDGHRIAGLEAVDAEVDKLMRNQRNITGIESEVALVQDYKKDAKGKRVSFESVNGEVSETESKAARIPTSSGGHNDNKETRTEPEMLRQAEADHIATKMVSMVMRMASNLDLTALRQGQTMLECISQRCTAPSYSALGLYLNIPPGQDSEPQDCVGKLDELLDLFPELEDIAMDEHMLAWMIRGLQLTGQSIDIELIPACLVSFSELFNNKFKGVASHQVRFRTGELTDMICQARDDAEKMTDMESSDGKGSDDLIECPSHPYMDDMDKIWKAHLWSDPREESAKAREAGSEEM